MASSSDKPNPCKRPGKHGTLHRFRLEYGDQGDPHRRDWHTWAYDREHAAENFHDTNEMDFTLFGVFKARGC
jgi:hypothetical protein